MFKRAITVVAVGAVALGATACGTSKSGGSSSAGGSAALPTVKLMVGGIDKQIYLPYQLAQSLGLYKKYGVNVQLSTEVNGGVGAEDAMASGQVDMAGAWYIHTIDFQSKGKMVEDIVQLSGAPGEREMCSPKAGVHSAADFKGKTLGVTDLGSGTDELTQFLAAQKGITRHQYHTLAVGAGATAIAALKRGTAQCVMTTQPTVGALETMKLADSTIDLATTAGAQAALGGAWPAAGVLAKTDWVNSHKATVQKVVDALVATMHWINTHTAADIANALPQQFVQNSTITKEQYIAGLTTDKGQFLPDGIMPAGGPKVVDAMEKLIGTDVSKVTLANTFTNEFALQANKTRGPHHHDDARRRRRLIPPSTPDDGRLRIRRGRPPPVVGLRAVSRPARVRPKTPERSEADVTHAGSDAGLLGRRQECQALDDRLTGVRAGTSAALVLRGEAGIGKTELLRYVDQRATGCQVVRAAGVQSEMELSYASLHQLCSPVIGGLTRLPEPQRNALATAFGLQTGSVPDRFLVALATLSLLSAAAEHQPLVCLVDDAQWLDQASALTLGFVERRLMAESVLLVFAVREPTETEVLPGLPGLTVPELSRQVLASAAGLGGARTARRQRADRRPDGGSREPVGASGAPPRVDGSRAGRGIRGRG